MLTTCFLPLIYTALSLNMADRSVRTHNWERRILPQDQVPTPLTAIPWLPFAVLPDATRPQFRTLTPENAHGCPPRSSRCSCMEAEPVSALPSGYSSDSGSTDTAPWFRRPIPRESQLPGTESVTAQPTRTRRARRQAHQAISVGQPTLQLKRRGESVALKAAPSAQRAAPPQPPQHRHHGPAGSFTPMPRPLKSGMPLIPLPSAARVTDMQPPAVMPSTARPPRSRPPGTQPSATRLTGIQPPAVMPSTARSPMNLPRLDVEDFAGVEKYLEQ